jgi:hypothetical protein
MRAPQLVLLLVVLVGCPDRSISKLPPIQSGTVIKRIPVSADIDILFVIDNSSSTRDKQTVFAQNFPRFVQALDAFPLGRPNLHIGVVNTTVDIATPGFSSGASGCPSPDPGDDGLLQTTPGASGCTPPNGRFLSDFKTPEGPRTANYIGTLDQGLSCIAQIGSDGCGFEAPLESMKRALDRSRPENAGFIRNGAYLAVIILTDEDDASVKDPAVFSLPDSTVGGRNDFRVQPLFAYRCTNPISSSVPGTYTGCAPRVDSYLQDPHFYAQFLSSVKGPGQIVVAAIAGPPPGLVTNDSPPQTADRPDLATGPLTIAGNPTQPIALLPSCSATINGNPAVGRPAIRLASFVRDFGTRGRFYSICQGDYSAALADIGKTLFNAISPCLEGPIDPADADSANAGTQLQCTVTDLQVDDTSGEDAALIVPCEMQDARTPAAGGSRPCWWIDRDPAMCPAPDTGFVLEVERSEPPATGTNVVVECALALRPEEPSTRGPE